MEGYSARKPSNSSTKTKNSHPKKNKLKPSPNDTTVIWCNSAFMPYDKDDRSSVGSNTNAILPQAGKSRRKDFFSSSPISEEELRLREELAHEIEKELERELMEGILNLVRRLSDLKAKQITRDLKNLPMDGSDGWCRNFSCGVTALDDCFPRHVRRNGGGPAVARRRGDELRNRA